MGRLLLMLAAGAIFAGLMAMQADAQSFLLSQNGKSVGTANLSLNQGADGFDATAETKIDMPGLKYSFKESQTLDAGYRLVKAHLSGSVNGASATVDASKQGAQFLVKIAASGGVTNTPLTYHPHAVFFPDFDPAGLQALLNLGAAHNNAAMWALVPKQTGSITPMRVATDADMQGTLDGKPTEVHHLTVTIDTARIELFSSPANELLQTEWPDEGFALVRKGFKLTPPARPGAPPPAPQGQSPQQ